jgi:DegV family protein with EDD domain
MSIKILVDSSADISQSEALSRGLGYVSFEVRFGDKAYQDGVDINPEQFFNLLQTEDVFPKTSQINEEIFNEKFTELTADGSEVIAILLSSDLSGTYHCATRAAQNFNGKVSVIDSANASTGTRILIEYACRLVQEGKDRQTIVNLLEEKKKKIVFIALLDTLKYLQKGGRISHITALAGKLLNIKPVISLSGSVKLIGKAPGFRKGHNLLSEAIEKSGGIDFTMPYGVIYSGDGQDKLQAYVENSSALWKGKTENIPTYQLGCTVGAHIGPGAIGVAFFTNN